MGALLLVSFAGSVSADSSNATISPSGCNSKCQLDNLQTPYVNGNFTVVFPISSNSLAGILATGSISNFGTRTAYNVTLSLSWNITYIDQSTGLPTYSVVQKLGDFTLGNITERNTVSFTYNVPNACSCAPLPFRIDTLYANFAWNGGSSSNVIAPVQCSLQGGQYCKSN